MTEQPENDLLFESLRRLPRWEPPADFVQRLSAAATYQAASIESHSRYPTVHWLDVLNAIVPRTVFAGLVAVFAAALPWEQIVERPQATALVTAVVVVSISVRATMRTLRLED